MIGMGKLGGEELNFSSDIDVIYVYTSDAGAAGKITLHEYFDKLARRLRRFWRPVGSTKLIGSLNAYVYGDVTPAPPGTGPNGSGDRNCRVAMS